MKFADLLYLMLYFVLKFTAFILPKSAQSALGRGIAKFAYAVNFKHRKIIKANLRFCFPEKDELWVKKTARNVYKNFAQFGFDFLNNQAATKEDIKELVRLDNMDIVQKAFASKRVVVFFTAHYGCWELIPFIYASYFGGISIVTRTLDSKVMNELLIKNRTKHFDVELIDKVGGAKKMLLAIKNKRTLGILPDQDAGDNESMVVEFFGKKVNWNLGASIIAKKANALLLPAFIYRLDELENASKNGENLDFEGGNSSVNLGGNAGNLAFKNDENLSGNSSFENGKNLHGNLGENAGNLAFKNAKNFDGNLDKNTEFSAVNSNKARYAVRFFEPLDAANASKEELTIFQAKCVESMIKFKPDEYFFFHKRFKRFYGEIYG